jgi:hypothetical protein
MPWCHHEQADFPWFARGSHRSRTNPDFQIWYAPGWLSPARRAFELASVLALVTSYPAFATFRSMIPGSMGDIGNEPPYDVAARGAVFLLLGLGLLLAPLVVGGHLGNTELNEWRASVQRGQHLTAAGTLVWLMIRTVERTAFRNVWLDEHVAFTPSSGKQFEVVCTRRARDVAAAYRPFSGLTASIGDKLTVGYLDQVNPDGLVSALQISREGDHS